MKALDPEEAKVTKDMAIRIAWVALIWFVFASVPASELKGQTQTSEDSAVLRGLLAASCEEANGSYWVISTEANPVDRVPESSVSLFSEAATGAIQRSARQAVLPTFQCPGLRWESMASIDAARRASAGVPKLEAPRPGWEGFFARFPNAQGILRVSLPGYSADGSVAAVFLSITGFRASASSWRELRKIRGAWSQVGFYPGAVG